MTEKSKVFNQTRKFYMEKIAATDLNMTAEKLGMTMTSQGARVKYFNNFYYIKENDIVDENDNPVDFDALVALSKYILLCPDVPSLNRQWTAYRDFKDSGPLLKFFADAVEGRLLPLLPAGWMTWPPPLTEWVVNPPKKNFPMT